MIRINGQPVGTSLPESFWHGFFVFTTLRLEGGEPLWLPEHLERLRHHAEALGIAFPGFGALEREVEHYREQRSDLLLRLAVAPEGYASSARPFAPPPEPAYTYGVSVHVTSLRVHPDLGRYKSGNYLPYRLARREAEQEGCFEGLLLDVHGHVVDGSRTSPLLWRDGELWVLEGGVEGITRQKVVDHATQMGLPVFLAYIRPQELEGQLLLAGTGIGLLSVGKPLDSVLEALITHFRPSGPSSRG
ncbi:MULTISPECIES: aminotransferase class IV [unclassified Meiothermus]|uniref:aminotransferase class IV n=1 Tax=unclassified Meiothermus TaxID=370471 RepID=UPI000D7D16F8|nr:MULTISPECIES: aminotransferase class IV [unclassified Meiothermus]PZA07036.1 4-amino-4-deoxychorismate lyase [Meiothermus sp. Pnk-1]RYM34285.1 4-amino-4-deoxychorismate lyase [Meiothermus sp. PNK-Is4]